MTNNKTPGSDGITVEFYKFFWNDICNTLIDSFNFAFIKGELSIDQKRGILTLTPKKDKDRYFLKNWRPIALLNNDYKILAKLLANRFKNVINNIIDHDQTGYLKGRYIVENIRTVADVIHYLREKHAPGVLLQIDFEKAFDSINWQFIQKTLLAFNFGPSFCHWVETLYKNSQSAIINNGHITEFFISKEVSDRVVLCQFIFFL